MCVKLLVWKEKKVQRARWGVKYCSSGLPFAPTYLDYNYLVIPKLLFFRSVPFRYARLVYLLYLNGGYICFRLECFRLSASFIFV